MAIFLFFQTSGLDGGLIKELVTNEESGDGDDDEVESKVIVVDGFKALQLDEDTVEASGIISDKAERMSIKLETVAYAEVVDVAPLVALKTEFEAALAQQNILINDLSNHNKILNRAEALHKAKSLSARELDKIRAERDIKSSKLSAINTHLASIKYKVKSLWGKKIASFIYDGDRRSDFNLIASNQVKLILLSLPKNKVFEHQQQKVFISHTNEREQAVEAAYIAPANYVSNPLYGESFLYSVESNKIRAGMKLFAWVDKNEKDIDGLFIPDDAVVWYANEPWVYLHHEEALFIRKPLSDARKISGGWLLENESFISDDLLVVRGGQTLLSEEFKWAIPDEDDD